MIDIYQIINNAYEIRINSDIIKCMHQYIEENNIQKLFNVIMKNNNYLFLDEITRTLLLNEQWWNIQCPNTQWQINMHWLSPADEQT